MKTLIIILLTTLICGVIKAQDCECRPMVDIVKKEGEYLHIIKYEPERFIREDHLVDVRVVCKHRVIHRSFFYLVITDGEWSIGPKWGRGDIISASLYAIELKRTFNSVEDLWEYIRLPE